MNRIIQYLIGLTSEGVKGVWASINYFLRGFLHPIAVRNKFFVLYKLIA